MEEFAGELSQVSLLKVMEEVEGQAWTGVVTVRKGEVEKEFYLQDGKVIFVTSNQPGERFGEFLSASGCMDKPRMIALVAESRRRNVRFTYDLIAEKVFDRAALEGALRRLVVVALAEALDWTSGHVRFTPRLPDNILSGPVHIEVAGALGKAVRYIMAEE